LGLFAGVVGARQKRLEKSKRALKNTSKIPSDILLTFHFKHLIDWRSQNDHKKFFFKFLQKDLPFLLGILYGDEIKFFRLYL